MHEGESRIVRIIEEALAEDLGLGDITTETIVPPGLPGEAQILFKESGIVAGLEVAAMTFSLVDPDVEVLPRARDGEGIAAGTAAALVRGRLSSILKAERTALNFLQRMSGIATLTRAFTEAVRGTAAKITDTRKTAPGLRLLDKRAVLLGGGVNHRFGLDDMVLIKDNHIAAAGGITAAVGLCLRALAERRLSPKIEVETGSLEEVREALRCGGIHRIMLDNFSVGAMREAVREAGGRVEVEASGNVTLANVRSVAETGVGFISVGALTHSAGALDISLDVSARS